MDFQDKVSYAMKNECKIWQPWRLHRKSHPFCCLLVVCFASSMQKSIIAATLCKYSANKCHSKLPGIAFWNCFTKFVGFGLMYFLLNLCYSTWNVYRMPDFFFFLCPRLTSLWFTCTISLFGIFILFW